MFKVIAFFLVSLNAYAEEPPEMLDALLDEEVAKESAPPAASGAGRPQIEVKQYGVTIIRRSDSGRVYLLDSPTGAHPSPGTLIVLKDGGTNVLSLRVLKTFYESGDTFAARVVRSYLGTSTLDSGTDILAVEKMRDIEYVEVPYSTPTPPSGGEAPGEEPLPQVLAFDPDLDAASSPTPDPFLSTDEIESSAALPSRLAVADFEEFDPYDHWISAGVGLFTSVLPSGSQNVITFNGGPLIQYAYSIQKMLILNRPRVQDSLEVEAGIGFFSVEDLESSRRALYSILAPSALLRYSLKFSPNFSIYLHAGAQTPFLVTNKNGVPLILNHFALGNTLQRIIPAVGGGAFFRIGPKWYVRVHAGFESFLGCLTVRF